jgi:hypothetical protein
MASDTEEPVLSLRSVADPFLMNAACEEFGESPKITGTANLMGHLLISSKNGSAKETWFNGQLLPSIKF